MNRTSRSAGIGLALSLAASAATAQPYTANWSPLDAGVSNIVFALAEYDDGSGPDLYAGGLFTNAGFTANYVARWDGAAWTALGSSLNGTVHDLVVYDDGGGPDLYACGSFTVAGGVAANRVARWDGANWTTLGSGISGGSLPDVFDLCVYNDGSGDALYAAGHFNTAGSATALSIAKWNGSSWSALGTGFNHEAYRMAVYNDGGGDALFVGGLFTTAGGSSANYIARWRSGAWTAVGSGANGRVRAFAKHTDASGTALYIGGNFSTLSGVPANRIARMSGTTISAVGTGIVPGTFAPGVRALLSFDLDGSGFNELYAGGDFVSSGGTPTANVSRWDGAAWTALDTGTNAWVESLGGMSGVTPNGAPALFVGGGFTTAGGVGASRVAAYACDCVIDFAPPFCTIDFFDIMAYLSLLAGGNLQADLNADGIIDFFDISYFLSVYSSGCP